MLAFDIETEGLDSRFDEITVASIYDAAKGISRTFNFATDQSPDQKERTDFIRALNEADALCCFNGVRFDIPFIARRCVGCSQSIAPAHPGANLMHTLNLAGSGCLLNSKGAGCSRHLTSSRCVSCVSSPPAASTTC